MVGRHMIPRDVTDPWDREKELILAFLKEAEERQHRVGGNVLRSPYLLSTTVCLFLLQVNDCLRTPIGPHSKP
jgi:hypothetical protein